MNWRTILIDWPAKGFDYLALWYWMLIAMLTIVCFVTAALWLLAALVGLPLP